MNFIPTRKQCASIKFSGFFIMLFNYSTVAEVFDTVLVLLAKKPIIALQWWHHSTVLLFWCSVRAGV